jgi:hypothetical protein
VVAGAGPSPWPGLGGNLFDGHDVEAEGLDQCEEVVQVFVVVHHAGDDCLGRYWVDVHADEGVARTIGQQPRDPDLVPSSWHDPSLLMSSAVADDPAALLLILGAYRGRGLTPVR